jgi:hypothetical protein
MLALTATLLALSPRCDLAKRHVVVYKLKKVGGTSLCLLLGTYALQRNLTVSTGRGHSWERNGASAPSDAALRAGEVDVTCQHMRHPHAHGRPVLHIATMRHPAEEFVSCLPRELELLQSPFTRTQPVMATGL